MFSRFISHFVLPVALSLTVLPSSTQAAVQNRIAGAVSGNSRTPLQGTIGGHAKHSLDLGVAPGDRKLDSLSVRFSMTPAQQADLNQLLAAQLNPSSPSYHQWLTSEQFGARFGLSSSDVARSPHGSRARALPSLASQGVPPLSLSPAPSPRQSRPSERLFIQCHSTANRTSPT